MLLRLGAATGARLHALPRCRGDADLHRLVMWSTIVFGVAQTWIRLAELLRSPSSRFPTFSRWHVLVSALSSWKGAH